jgi:N-methylhydantoinase A
MEGIYDMSVDRPAPLVPRRRCLEAIERIGPQGEIIVPLDVASVERAAESFARQEVEAVAICFLFSFLNPDHERRAAEILARRLQGVAISQSHRISPEYREYERASTAVINAYLSPVMTDYLDRLNARIANLFGDAGCSSFRQTAGQRGRNRAFLRGCDSELRPGRRVVAAACMGGGTARRIVSGRYGRRLRHGRSSMDVWVTTEEASGPPVSFYHDLHIIGAGGGSIAWIDSGGALNVGPRSAGAHPASVLAAAAGGSHRCQLVLGRLDPLTLCWRACVAADRAAAKSATAVLADRLGPTLEDAALGIMKVMNANMVKGIVTVTVLRGSSMLGGGWSQGRRPGHHELTVRCQAPLTSNGLSRWSMRSAGSIRRYAFFFEGEPIELESPGSGVQGERSDRAAVLAAKFDQLTGAGKACRSTESWTSRPPSSGAIPAARHEAAGPALVEEAKLTTLFRRARRMSADLGLFVKPRSAYDRSGDDAGDRYALRKSPTRWATREVRTVCSPSSPRSETSPA